MIIKLDLGVYTHHKQPHLRVYHKIKVSVSVFLLFVNCFNVRCRKEIEKYFLV